MANNLLFILPVFCLWVAVSALTFLVVREIGWARAKQYRFTLALLAVSLMALPGAGVVRITRPYQSRILAILLRRHSAAISFSGTCSIFPADNIWNANVRRLPLDPRSEEYVLSIGPDLPLHADFGVTGGIPYTVVDGDQPPAHVSITDGAAESDPGPYRIPDNAAVEPGSDSHVLVLDDRQCLLYELFAASHTGPGEWQASSGAIFNLRLNRLRPEGWTSSDAAGLPILPGLVRYDEVKSGAIRHALRFTARLTRRAFVWPGTHFASHSTDPNLPPMAQRFRLRGSFDMSGFSPDTRVILTALQEYGMFLADNGGPWYLTGAPDSRWSSTLIAELRRVSGQEFEAVDSSSLMVDRGSAEALR